MNQRIRIVLLVVALALAFTAAITSAQTANFTHTIASVTAAPNVDGVLTDATWLQASQKGSKVAIDINHTATALVPYPRVAYLAYDDEAIYVAVVAYVPDPDKLVTNMSTTSHNDEIEVFLGPASGGYHHIIVTAGGEMSHRQYNTQTSDGIELHHAVKVDDIKWVVELAIPFESLGETPSAGDQWKLNLTGRQVGAGDTWIAWNPTYGGFHNDSRFATLVFGD